MAAKYSDINRGPELQNLYNKLQDWRKLDPAEKRTLYRSVAKPAAERVKTEFVTSWVRPFSAARNDIYYETQIPSVTQTGEGQDIATLIRTLLAGRFVQVAPAGATDTLIVIPKFSFAKVRVSKRAGDSGNVNATSRLTGKPYTRWRSNSMQGNFGKSDTQSDYYESVKTIKGLTAYTDFDNVRGNTISFRPEGA